MARPDITVKVSLEDSGLKAGFEAIAKVVDKFTKNADKLIKTQKSLVAEQKKLKKSQEDLNKQKQKSISWEKQANSWMKKSRVASEKKATNDKKLIKLAQDLLTKEQTLLDVENQRTKAIKRKLNLKEAARLKKVKTAEKNLIQVRSLAMKQLKQMSLATKAAQTNFKKLGISSRTLKQALRGSSVAIGQVRKSLQLANITMKTTHKGMFDITNGGRLLSNGFATMRSKLLLASFAMSLVTSGILRQVKAFGEQEDSVLKMARVFGTDAAKSLDAYSSSLQETTRFGDELINSVIATMGAFGANEEQAKGLTEATLDLSEGLGIDLNTAGQLVAKTFGSSTNALSRYGIELESGLTKQERFAAITEGVKEKFGELATLMSKTTKGQLAQTSNAFGDLQERLGEALIPLVLTFAKALKSAAEAMPVKTLRVIIALFISLTSALIAGKLALFIYTSAMAIATAITNLQTAAIVRATIAQRALNLAAKMNPYVAVASALAFVGTALLSYSAATKGLTEDEKKLQERINKVAFEKGLLKNATDELNDSELELIKSIFESEDAIQKQIDAIQAEIQFKGVELEIKKKEIELGRELEQSEIDLIRTLENKKDVLKGLKDAEQDIIDTKTYLLNLTKDSIDAQIAEAEAMLNTALLMNMMSKLSKDEAANIDVLRQNIEDLKNSRYGEGESIETQVHILDTLNDAYEQTKIAQMALMEVQILEATILAKQGELTANQLAGLFSLIQAYNKLRAVKSDVAKDEEKTHKISMFQNAQQRDSVTLLMSSFSAMAKQHKQGQLVAARVSQLAAIINTWEGVTEALSTKDYIGATTILFQGLAAVAQIENAMGKMGGSGGGGGGGGTVAPILGYEDGGYVGGNRHSQGGTIIEAERGEFVMSRNATESIGLETLNQMNQGGGGGGNINVNVSGNVLTQDFVEGELAGQIKEALRRGVDFGVDDHKHGPFTKGIR